MLRFTREELLGEHNNTDLLKVFNYVGLEPFVAKDAVDAGLTTNGRMAGVMLNRRIGIQVNGRELVLVEHNRSIKRAGGRMNVYQFVPLSNDEVPAVSNSPSLPAQSSSIIAEQEKAAQFYLLTFSGEEFTNVKVYDKGAAQLLGPYTFEEFKKRLIALFQSGTIHGPNPWCQVLIGLHGSGCTKLHAQAATSIPLEHLQNRELFVQHANGARGGK